MTKKSQIWLVIIVIIFVILLVLFFLVLFANRQGYFKSPEDKITKIDKVFIKAEEGKSMNYALFSSNFLFHKGYLNSGEITELNNVPIENLSIYCWNNDTYPINFTYHFSQEELSQEKAIIICSNNKVKGKVSLNLIGELSPISIITLNISVKDNLNDFKVCTSWSGGIISVSLENGLVCNQINCLPIKLYNYTSKQYYYSSKCNSSWVSWSEYNYSTDKLILLEKGKYRCADWITSCEEISENICYPYISIPQEYKNSIDKCWHISKNLQDESYTVPFIVKTMPSLSSLDFVKFLVIDNSKYFDEITSQFEYGTYYNGDIGIKNSEYIFKAKNG